MVFVVLTLSTYSTHRSIDLTRMAFDRRRRRRRGEGERASGRDEEGGLRWRSEKNSLALFSYVLNVLL